MELTYLNPTHTLIVAHLDAGETLGTLEGGEHGATHYIKVDGQDPNYVELLAKDPQLESVTDPGEVMMPPAQEAPPPSGEGAPPPEHPPHPEHPAKAEHEEAAKAAPAPPKPAAPAAHAAPKPAAPAQQPPHRR